MINDDDTRVITEYLQAKQDLKQYSNRQCRIGRLAALFVLAALFLFIVSWPLGLASSIIAAVILIWLLLFSLNDDGRSRLHDFEKNFQQAEVKYFVVMQREYDVYRNKIIEEFDRRSEQEKDA